MQATLTLTTKPSLQRLDFWMYAFIVLHILIWTIAPASLRYTLPMDSIEGTIWGHQLEWGYDKHPFLNAWIIALAVKLGESGWGIYLFSQLSVALCFWAVWELGKRIVPPLYAFVAVLSLECIQYYNLHAIDLNNNSLEPGFWSLTILYFYLGLKENKLHQWLLTGFFAGLSLMTKYYAIMLFISMALFLIYQRDAHSILKNRKFYLGFFTFLLVIAPHTIWLFSHHFTTFTYAIDRVSAAPSLLNHIFFPLQFFWQQIEVFIPVVVIGSVLFIGKKTSSGIIETKARLSKFDSSFLLFIGLGPIVLTLLVSAIMGLKLRAGWGQPLLTYWPLILFAFMMPALTAVRVKRFVAAVCFFLGMIVTGYTISMLEAKKPSSANFPGKDIAVTLTDEWHRKYKVPLAYVVGPREMAGNIAFHSKDKPSVYINGDTLSSPWINENELRQKGGIFVWDPSERSQMKAAEMQKRFPLRSFKVRNFAWKRNKDMKPVIVITAYLPPTKPQP